MNYYHLYDPVQWANLQGRGVVLLQDKNRYFSCWYQNKLQIIHVYTTTAIPKHAKEVPYPFWIPKHHLPFSLERFPKRLSDFYYGCLPLLATYKTKSFVSETTPEKHWRLLPCKVLTPWGDHPVDQLMYALSVKKQHPQQFYLEQFHTANFKAVRFRLAQRDFFLRWYFIRPEAFKKPQGLLQITLPWNAIEKFLPLLEKGETGIPWIDYICRKIHQRVVLSWQELYSFIVFCCCYLLLPWNEVFEWYISHYPWQEWRYLSGLWMYYAGMMQVQWHFFPLAFHRLLRRYGKDIKKWLPELRRLPKQQWYWWHLGTYKSRHYPAPCVAVQMAWRRFRLYYLQATNQWISPFALYKEHYLL